MKVMLRRLFIASIAALLLAGPASAGQIVVKLGLAPGKLQVSAARVATSTVTLTVADGRGNGKGWTLRSSQPVVVTGITARCAAGSTCTLPASDVTPSGRSVLVASRDTGMGVMTIVIKVASPEPSLTFSIA